MKKKGFLVLIIILVLLVAGTLVFVCANKKEEKAETETGNSCKYTDEQLRMYGLQYFVSLNGTTAENGEAYVSSLETLEDGEVLVVISHLQTDHSTTDARYTINCNTGVGTDDEDQTIEFVK